MRMIDRRTDPSWLTRAVEDVTVGGFALVANVLDPTFLEETRRALHRAQSRIGAEVGEERLARAVLHRAW